jgi:N-acetylglucosamine-6-phosphate deacetylase
MYTYPHLNFIVFKGIVLKICILLFCAISINGQTFESNQEALTVLIAKALIEVQNAKTTRGQMATGSYQMYKESGMTNLQILQSATMHPGVLLAGEGKIGLLQNGYFADIIAVEENPLENIRTLENVVFVIKEGVIY